VKSTVREAYLLQPTGAFTPEQPVAQARHRQPLAEKASSRWLEGEQLACEVQQRGPETRVVHVADRDGDLHAWVLDAMRR
jgi:hypothetical protein